MIASTRMTRVLLVEDNLAEADLVRSLLARSHRYHFAIEHCSRLEGALDVLMEDGADALLLDLQLPDSYGLDGLKRLLAVAPTLPVVVLTNQRDEALAHALVREGAQDYLIKGDVDTILLERTLGYAIERAQANETLRESEERYALAVTGASDGIWDWNLLLDQSHYSPRFLALLDIPHQPPPQPGLSTWTQCIVPEDLDAFRAELDAHLAGESPRFEHEHRIALRSGEQRWMLARGIAVRDGKGVPRRIAGSLSDITRHKRAEEQLLHDSLHDPLTRLPNRLLFTNRLEHALRAYRRQSARTFAVLFFDIDHFKAINDTLGHLAGDELLVFIARRLEKLLRPGDTVARMSGDEFVVLLAEVEGAADAVIVAERVLELMSERFTLHGQDVYTSVSIGVALGGDEHRRAADILRDADLAMYRAKAEGRGRFALFDDAMHESAMARARLECQLRRALDEGQLVLHYQPIIHLASGRVSGFEALLRWQHPEWGMVYPDSFIEVATDSGLIVPFGWWALREACTRTHAWQQLFPLDPPLWISVNLSGQLLAEKDMPARLDRLLTETGLPPGSLRLELTEHEILRHGDSVIDLLSELRARGVKLQVDDFGTGYSSLSYLQRLSYDSVKIDRTFVGRMGNGNGHRSLVSTMVALGGMLDMRVVAEGVETNEQYEWLRSIGCPEAQGFWFSRPMATDAVGTYLNSGSTD